MELWMDEPVVLSSPNVMITNMFLIAKYDYDNPGFSPETGHFTKSSGKTPNKSLVLWQIAERGLSFPIPQSTSSAAKPSWKHPRTIPGGRATVQMKETSPISPIKKTRILEATLDRQPNLEMHFQATCIATAAPIAAFALTSSQPIGDESSNGFLNMASNSLISHTESGPIAGSKDDAVNQHNAYRKHYSASSLTRCDVG
ncbi:hypothetical protein BD779DRAFT_1800267 [Infundibulicybe gibba]|nr:hypothetical protein BD779DRAFT_1800267 [Infundibulicybe gibba]